MTVRILVRSGSSNCSVRPTHRGDRLARMPSIADWRISNKQGAILAARAQARYDALYHERPHFTHPALRWHLEQNILPGLALYQVLSKESNDRDAVLSETVSLL